MYFDFKACMFKLEDFRWNSDLSVPD